MSAMVRQTRKIRTTAQTITSPCFWFDNGQCVGIYSNNVSVLLVELVPVERDVTSVHFMITREEESGTQLRSRIFCQWMPKDIV